MPDSLGDAEAAPLLCAGTTTFDALRRSGARPAISLRCMGVGGHWAPGHSVRAQVWLQGSGNRTRIWQRRARDDDSAPASIDAGRRMPHRQLQLLGGAQVILATAPSSKAISELVDGLTVTGKLLVVGRRSRPQKLHTTPALVGGRGSRSIQGYASGTPADSEDTVRFAELSGVRPMIETYPLGEAADALRPHDERPGTVPGGPDDVMSRRATEATVPRRSRRRIA